MSCDDEVRAITEQKKIDQIRRDLEACIDPFMPFGSTRSSIDTLLATHAFQAKSLRYAKFLLDVVARLTADLAATSEIVADHSATVDRALQLEHDLAAMTAERDALINVQAQLNGVMCGVRAERDAFKARAEAAERDLNRCCPCEACNKSCKYDKANAYDKCADFEWRSPVASDQS